MNDLSRVPVQCRPQPDSFHDRTGHKLEPENSQVYKALQMTEKYAEENEMRINYKKTKMILFNPGSAKDFHPRFNLGNTEIDLVEETKLVCVVVRRNLSWSSKTDYMVG